MSLPKKVGKLQPFSESKRLCIWIIQQGWWLASGLWSSSTDSVKTFCRVMLASHFNDNIPKEHTPSIPETQNESISFMNCWARFLDYVPTTRLSSHPFWPALARRLCASGEHPPSRTVQTLHGRAIPVKARPDCGLVEIRKSWPLRTGNETFSSCRCNQ